jgi:hypothetical protein
MDGGGAQVAELKECCTSHTAAGTPAGIVNKVNVDIRSMTQPPFTAMIGRCRSSCDNSAFRFPSFVCSLG